MNSNNIIISRHSGLVDFLREQGIEGEVIAHATPEAVKNRHVYGNIPMNLAALAAQVTTVDMTVPAERRGTELSAKDMKSFGATLRTYQVTLVEDN